MAEFDRASGWLCRSDLVMLVGPLAGAAWG
jgi:hypothetical protein